MIGILEQTLFTFGETPITGLHILTVVIAGTIAGWSYLKGIPFVDKTRPELFEHKSLKQLREPEFRDILNNYGKDLNRKFYHDKKQIGIVDREITYRIQTDTSDDEGILRHSTKMFPDRLEDKTPENDVGRVSLFYIRDDKIGMNLLKKFVGLPQRIYDIVIVPERYLVDADNLVLNKNVNLVRYAGVFTVWCPEVKGLFKAFNSKDVEEQIDENLVNFLRRATHFDVEQAKETQFKKFETEMEKLRWGDKDQRDSSKV